MSNHGIETPIEWKYAFRLGNVDYLKASGVNSGNVNDFDGFFPHFTLLEYACVHGVVDVVKWLLSIGARVDGHMGDGITALYAASKWYMPMALTLTRMLLQAGANPNIKSDHGMYPLDTPLSFEHAEVVQELLAHGARLDLLEEPTKYPFVSRLCQSRCKAAVVTLLGLLQTRRSPLLQLIARDASRLVVRAVWDTRAELKWAA